MSYFFRKIKIIFKKKSIFSSDFLQVKNGPKIFFSKWTFNYSKKKLKLDFLSSFYICNNYLINLVVIFFSKN